MSNSIDKSNASYMDTYAWILYQLKEYKSAKEWQEKALRTSNLSDPLMFEHYGDILYRLGDIDNAVKSWIKAKEKGAKSEQLNKKIADKKLNE
jgi:predicted negative regulator of RcsB-dependent stress response